MTKDQYLKYKENQKSLDYYKEIFELFKKEGIVLQVKQGLYTSSETTLQPFYGVLGNLLQRDEAIQKLGDAIHKEIFDLLKTKIMEIEKMNEDI